MQGMMKSKGDISLKLGMFSISISTFSPECCTQPLLFLIAFKSLLQR